MLRKRRAKRTAFYNASLGRRHTHTHTQDQTCVTHRQHAAGGVGAGKPRRTAKEARKKAPRRRQKEKRPRDTQTPPRQTRGGQRGRRHHRKTQGNSRRRERKHSYNTTFYIAKEGTEGSTQGKARASHLRTSCSYIHFITVLHSSLAAKASLTRSKSDRTLHFKLN